MASEMTMDGRAVWFSTPVKARDDETSYPFPFASLALHQRPEFWGHAAGMHLANMAEHERQLRRNAENWPAVLVGTED